MTRRHSPSSDNALVMMMSGSESERPAPSGSGPGAREAQASVRILLTLPVAVLTAFMLGRALGLGHGPGGWTFWIRLALLAILISTPSGVGMALGRRAARQGATLGTVGVVLNLVFGLFLVTVTVIGTVVWPG